MARDMKLVAYVDGGARGNPGPAAAASVLCSPDGDVLAEAAELLGETTNNVAEYRAVLLGAERALALGATELHIVNDSELVARQLTGRYKVKHQAMRALHARALEALAPFARWSIETVPRARNTHADALVNAALDGRAEGA
ncbi:MAG: ribonuclease HI family protein [Solirubrobacteraceae bacterium]